MKARKTRIKAVGLINHAFDDVAIRINFQSQLPILPHFIQLYITTIWGTIYLFYAIRLHQLKPMRCIPSSCLCQSCTIEYWNMLSFKPRHICCQNNSAWTCSKLSYKFPQPSLTTKKINTCKYRTIIKFKKKNHFRSVHKQKTGIKFPIHVWMGRSD